jgi:hypothetical protein
LFKIRKIVPNAYYEILESYLKDRFFQVIFKDEITTLRKTEAGVPQGSVFGPVLYLIYTSNLTTSDNTTTATFADVTTILATDTDPAIASMKLQATNNKIVNWAKKWRIKINQSKPKHITFSLRNETCPTVQMGNVALPQKYEVEYLGMHLNRRLDMSKAHQNQKKPAQPKNETNALATRKKINTINRIGDSLQFQHRNSPALSIQD